MGSEYVIDGGRTIGDCEGCETLEEQLHCLLRRAEARIAELEQDLADERDRCAMLEQELEEAKADRMTTLVDPATMAELMRDD